MSVGPVMITPLIGPIGEPTLRTILRIGDVLLYTPASMFGRFITIKTWSEFSHAELFLGQSGRDVWASRDPECWIPQRGGGVDYYSLRIAQLAVIRRPRCHLNVDAVIAFCDAAVGQRYDWWGLARFFTIGVGKPDRMFCSEAVSRALRVGGCHLFDNADCDEVSPGMLDLTRDLAEVWRLRPHAH